MYMFTAINAINLLLVFLNILIFLNEKTVCDSDELSLQPEMILTS